MAVSAVAAVVALAAPLTAIAVDNGGWRPNVVWVMADDLGWGEVGLFPAVSPHGRIATPNLDTFGEEGMVFWHAYAGYTVCAPSRTTLFTGRHSGRFKEHGLDGQAIQLAQNVTTLAEVLQGAGYATGAFGKLAPLTSPLKQGFDAFIGQVDQALCHNMYPNHIDHGSGQLNFELTGNMRKKSRMDCMAHPEHYNYTIDVFHEAAMEWLQQAASGPRPFFLYLSFTVPHAGGWGDAPYSPEQGAPVPSDLQYASKDWPDVEKDHAAVITYLDAKVGDLMRRLKKLGVDNETLVFFASDNGAHLEGHHSPAFFNSTGGLKGHKRSLFEGGTRSPTMARWPSHIPAGSKSEFPWAFWDVLPTLADLAGAETPRGLDGISIVPTLRGRPQAGHDYLFWTWPASRADDEEGPSAGCGSGVCGGSGYAVRVGAWKGIVAECRLEEGRRQPSLLDEMRLFNLEADPFETTDVAALHHGVVTGLQKLIVAQNLTCDCYQCGLSQLSEVLV